jgi:hypothetical protein
VCQWFAGELIGQSNQESLDQFDVKLRVRTWSPGRKRANPRKSYNVCTTSQLPSQPPTSHILPLSFLVRAPASKTSEIVKMSVYQRCKNIQLCLFFSFFGEKFIFAVDPVHCWSPLVHRSIQNNFTFLFLFLTCTSNFFLSRVLELTTAIYYISIIYVNF